MEDLFASLGGTSGGTSLGEIISNNSSLITSFGIGAIIVALIKVSNDVRKSKLERITDKRSNWRKEMRDIIDNWHVSSDHIEKGIECKDSTNKTKQLQNIYKLMIRINPDGMRGIKGSNKWYMNSGHIWELLLKSGQKHERNSKSLTTQSNEADDEILMPEDEVKLIRYLSLLLNLEWEKSKKETQTNIFKGLELLIRAFILGLAFFIMYKNIIVLHQGNSRTDISANLLVFAIIVSISLFTMMYANRALPRILMVASDVKPRKVDKKNSGETDEEATKRSLRINPYYERGEVSGQLGDTRSTNIFIAYIREKWIEITMFSIALAVIRGIMSTSDSSNSSVIRITSLLLFGFCGIILVSVYDYFHEKWDLKKRIEKLRLLYVVRFWSVFLGVVCHIFVRNKLTASPYGWFVAILLIVMVSGYSFSGKDKNFMGGNIGSVYKIESEEGDKDKRNNENKDESSSEITEKKCKAFSFSNIINSFKVVCSYIAKEKQIWWEVILPYFIFGIIASYGGSLIFDKLGKFLSPMDSVNYKILYVGFFIAVFMNLNIQLNGNLIRQYWVALYILLEGVTVYFILTASYTLLFMERKISNTVVMPQIIVKIIALFSGFSNLILSNSYFILNLWNRVMTHRNVSQVQKIV